MGGIISLFLFWLIFITATTNFYNFMDGINGITGLTGLVGFGLMAYFPTLLGFVFASFVDKLSTSINIFLCLIMFLCTFYADAVITIYYRWRGGENLMQAHRSHLYQYMSNELGYPHWKVSLLYAVVQLAVGIIAIWAYQHGIALQIVLVAVYGIVFIFSYMLIKTIKPKRLKQQAVRI